MQQTSNFLKPQIAYLADDQVTRPVGVRVVEPPPDTRQALRGNLYAVVELPTNTADFEAFSERLLSAIQRTYYTVKGTQSHVLREALREAKRTLDSYNEALATPPVRAAIVIATVLGRRVLIVSNGLGLALITAGNSVDVYPPYSADAPAQEATEPEDGWEIYRQELVAGGALFIGGRRWLEWLTLRELASTVAYLTADNCADAAASLLDQAHQSSLPGLLIILTPANGDAPARAIVPTVRRGRLGGLPTSLNAALPLQEYAAARAATTNADALRATAAVAAHDLSHGQRPEADVVDDELATDLGAEEATQQPTAALRAQVAGSLRNGRQQLQAFWRTLMPDRSANPVDPVRPDPPVNHAPVYQPAAALPPATPPQRAQGSRARLFILIAALILVLVPVLVAVQQWQQGASVRGDAEALLDLGEARLASAREAADAGDKVSARTMLADAEAHVEQARTLLTVRSPRADALAVEIQRDKIDVLQIQPLYGIVQPLVRFPTNAQPHRLLVVDQDIYVLDSGRQSVLHFRLDLNTNTVPDQAGDTVVQQGDRIGDGELGRPIAMTWQDPIPGIEDKPNLLILDHNSQLFSYDPRVEGVTRVDISSAQTWVAPGLIYAYLGRLYVLDVGANQLLRYDPSNYGQAAEPWFAATTPVNLNGVQTMAIDGDIWLLYSNGQVVRYQQGLQMNFALDNSIPLPGEPVDMAVGSQSDSLIYLADRNEQRILVFDKEGKYQRQLQAAEGEPLRGLSALYVDEVGDNIYILTQSALYEQALPN